ncbi:MAG: hypothetical protein PHV49_00490 [Alistipes sp.]|nr:hypothetical protein [Alistipes sp.]
MKIFLHFILYFALFFAVTFGILYGGERWIFHTGESVGSIGVNAVVCAAVFAVFMSMVLRRSERGARRGKTSASDRFTSFEK